MEMQNGGPGGDRCRQMSGADGQRRGAFLLTGLTPVALKACRLYLRPFSGGSDGSLNGSTGHVQGQIISLQSWA